MPKYDFKSIEAKRQKLWEENQVFKAQDNSTKPKCYILDMFPYPSSFGLHIGHPLGYTATDIIARVRHMQGYNVMHPMGFDAFGLPAENFAIKKGIHPAVTTNQNIDNFRRQLKMLGLSYDWSREINTSSSEYYKWTQWMFLFLYKNGLAYKKKAPVNWCGSCQTVLANEQVIEGKCERCKNNIIQKELSQWFFKVTAYADRLLADLEKIDWPEKIKLMQKNWIGKSEGVEVNFAGVTNFDEDGQVKEKEFSLTVFTTRVDTLFGVIALVLAPEHPLVLNLVAPTERAEVLKYIEAAGRKTELVRTSSVEKTGLALGANVKHPLTGSDVPLFVSDYVVAGYGTSAVMVVPAHDERDFVFAKKYGLEILWVVAPRAGVEYKIEAAYTEPGILVNSGEFNGLTSAEAKPAITQILESKKLGQHKTYYRLRDWLVSRQRYWGAPIPIVYCPDCGELPVPEADLPVLLPTDVDFRPTGESPLTRSESFHAVLCPKCGQAAQRESDTMDTFVDSSWYYLRYTSPNNISAPFDRAMIDYWCPVDMYVGGAEHAVLHLLYARFFAKALFDFGEISFEEPFTSLRNQGLILGEDGQRMSKSRGNVVNPDEVVAEHGADVLRMYLMFMADFVDSKPWSAKGIVGISRFLDRIWEHTHQILHGHKTSANSKIISSLHQTIKKVTADIETCKFNTAISALMIFHNEWIDEGSLDAQVAEQFLKLLSPFAPHLAEELFESLSLGGNILTTSWPIYDETLAAPKSVEVAVQVNGKIKTRLVVESNLTEENLRELAYNDAAVARAISGRQIKQTIVVPNRLVNIVLE